MTPTPIHETLALSGGALPPGCRLLAPPAQGLAARPALLLDFTCDWSADPVQLPSCQPALLFLAAGHRVATFELPHHRSRSGSYGAGITALGRAFLAGADPFAAFAVEGRALLERCLDDGLAEAGLVALSASSRSAYLGVRLLAHEPRIAAAALFAPVTDWQELAEMAPWRDRPEVAALALDTYVDRLAGRAIFTAIGNRDTRVGTASCCRFVAELAAANARVAAGADLLEFHCTPDPDHSLGSDWWRRGAEFLLQRLV